MKLDWISNDTIALLGLIVIAFASIFCGGENITSVAIGAIGGFIGSKVL